MNYRTFGLFCFLAGLVTSGCDLASVCGRDDDGDGINNCEDVCLLHYDNEIIDARQFEKNPDCNCDDTDEDGIIDCFDPCPKHADVTDKGVCGCGISPEGEGIYMTCPETSDVEDKCPNDPNKLLPGVCGCGVSDRMIRWNDDALTEGDPISECPPADNIDLCPFDPDKQIPGICGCGVPDTDTDGDTVPDCNDRCPEDALKLDNPGACGCGVEDSAVNLMDSDKDGTIDCLDECPDNPYKIIPGPTGCDHWDTDGDGVEDQDDACPFNPEIKALDDEGSQPECNYIVDEDGKTVFRVWNARDLERLRAEIDKKHNTKDGMMCDETDPRGGICRNNYEMQPWYDTGEPVEDDDDLWFYSFSISGADLEECFENNEMGLSIHVLESCTYGCGADYMPLKPGQYIHYYCSSPAVKCMQDGVESTEICLSDTMLYHCDTKTEEKCRCADNHCEACEKAAVTSGGNPGDCCVKDMYIPSCTNDNELLSCDDTGRIIATPCLNECREDSNNIATCIFDTSSDPFLVEIMSDLDLSTITPCNPKLGYVSNWHPITIYNTELEGNGHTISYGENLNNCYMSNPLFDQIVNSKISHLKIDLNVRGNINSAVATFVNNSLVEELEYNGSVIIDTSFFGEKTTGRACEILIHSEMSGDVGFEVEHPECTSTFGLIAGYASNSVFNHITINGTVGTKLNDVSISGFLGIANHSETNHLTINSDYLFAPNTSVTPFVFRILQSFLITNSRININNIESLSYHGITKDFDTLYISDLSISVETISTAHLYPFTSYKSLYATPFKSYDNSYSMGELCDNETKCYISDGYLNANRLSISTGNTNQSPDSIYDRYSGWETEILCASENMKCDLYNHIVVSDFQIHSHSENTYNINNYWNMLFEDATVDSINNMVITSNMSFDTKTNIPLIKTNNATNIYYLGDTSSENNEIVKPLISFTPSQTDDIVSRLGDKWTKKLVSFHNPETNADEEIYVPWLKSATNE